MWSDSERDYIKNNASLLTDLQIAVELTRITGRHITLASIRKQRQRLNIVKENGRGVCKIKKEKPNA